MLNLILFLLLVTASQTIVILVCFSGGSILYFFTTTAIFHLVIRCVCKTTFGHLSALLNPTILNTSHQDMFNDSEPSPKTEDLSLSSSASAKTSVNVCLLVEANSKKLINLYQPRERQSSKVCQVLKRKENLAYTGTSWGR